MAWLWPACRSRLPHIRKPRSPFDPCSLLGHRWSPRQDRCTKLLIHRRFPCKDLSRRKPGDSRGVSRSRPASYRCRTKARRHRLRRILRKSCRNSSRPHRVSLPRNRWLSGRFALVSSCTRPQSRMFHRRSWDRPCPSPPYKLRSCRPDTHPRSRCDSRIRHTDWSRCRMLRPRRYSVCSLCKPRRGRWRHRQVRPDRHSRYLQSILRTDCPSREELATYSPCLRCTSRVRRRPAHRVRHRERHQVQCRRFWRLHRQCFHRCRFRQRYCLRSRRACCRHLHRPRCHRCHCRRCYHRHPRCHRCHYCRHRHCCRRCRRCCRRPRCCLRFHRSTKVRPPRSCCPPEDQVRPHTLLHRPRH
jgi:hypothetical protein